MRQRSMRAFIVVFGLAALAGADWLAFRGTDNTGVAEPQKAPLAWSAPAEGESKNVAWKAPLPGKGVAGPIVVDGRVIVTSSSGYKQDRLHVTAFDAKSGAPVWERQFWATGRTYCHPTSAVAANTPASDGKLIFAFFSSNDLVCLDLDGNLQWVRGLTVDYPTAANDVGMASSPIVVGDTVIVQVECQGESFAAGLDKHTGETLWRVDRAAQANWASPTVLRGATAAEDLALLQSGDRLTAHRPATGEQVWSYDVACSTIPSATTDDGLVFVPSAGLTALRPDSSAGTVEALWKSAPLAPATASPIVYEGRVYSLNRAGVLTCGDAVTGEDVWRLRLKGSFWASPVVVGDRIYCVNQDGQAHVVRLDSTQGELLGTSEFGEMVLGSPAVANDALFVRSAGHLWKIAEGE